MLQKTYLGDGVYASFDGYQIWLTTEDGIRITNQIALDSSAFYNLVEFEKELRSKTKDKNEIHN